MYGSCDGTKRPPAAPGYTRLMLARVASYVLQGIDAIPCEVEVDTDDTQQESKVVVVGLPDAAVKESGERVKAALINSGYATPAGRVLINLAPADQRKEGPMYDLPIALGMLAVQNIIPMAGAGQRGAVIVRTARDRAKAAAAARSKAATPITPSAPTTSSTPAPSGDFDADLAALDQAIGVSGGEPGEPLDLRAYLVAGELALDGRLRPIRGVIAMAALARSLGLAGVIVPRDNAAEAAVVPGIEAIGAATLAEVVGMITGAVAPAYAPAIDINAMLTMAQPEVDFADVRGQEAVKRAIIVAAAGSHNLLMLGPAGTGKSMMAKALPGVLPALTADEAIEVTRIYSAAGVLRPGQGLVATRPVRSPHHTASGAAVIGGGAVPRPGEVSLAHRGVLFLDELPEFPRDVLETLRQPLEDHVVSIARSHSAVRFPASFMLVAAMNPTPKGDRGMDARASEPGRRAMDRYLSRLSGPLIDRIDIHVEAPAVPFGQLSATLANTGERARGTSTAMMRDSVTAARARQHARQGPVTPNSRLSGRQLDTLAPMTDDARALLGTAISELGLSARAYDKLRRVSRTIADLAAADTITVEHVAEAVQYRLLDRRV